MGDRDREPGHPIILPAAGKVEIDGKFADWDLSGGVFVCGDVEHQRDQLAVWIHALYDAENLYVLARWRDETPLSNPGLAGSDHPWNGDSLQLRIIADPERQAAGKPIICWANAWRDRAGKDAIDLDFPNKNGEVLRDAIAKGARQACQTDADGKGYVQELALPWKLLVPDGFTPKAGQRMVFSVEPNFNLTTGYRITLKDIFRPGVVPDRVFTFMASSCWGYGTFAPAGKVEPQRLRLADSREFAVTLRDGVPAIDWTGLFQERKTEGFAKIALDMPQDGYVSLNIKNADGQVVRQLVNAAFFTRGKHEVLWDGLTNLSHLQPGEVVPAGAYTWEAIYHTGLGLRLVGWADNAGSAPFDSPGGNWGGDHGLPCSVTTDGKAMYLGWSGSEAGKAVVVTDLAGKVLWRHTRGGFGGANHVAVANGVVYVNDNQQNESVIYRLDARKGEYSNWQGRNSADLRIEPGLAGIGRGQRQALSQPGPGRARARRRHRRRVGEGRGGAAGRPRSRPGRRRVRAQRRHPGHAARGQRRRPAGRDGAEQGPSPGHRPRRCVLRRGRRPRERGPGLRPGRQAAADHRQAGRPGPARSLGCQPGCGSSAGCGWMPTACSGRRRRTPPPSDSPAGRPPTAASCASSSAPPPTAPWAGRSRPTIR